MRHCKEVCVCVCVCVRAADDFGGEGESTQNAHGRKRTTSHPALSAKPGKYNSTEPSPAKGEDPLHSICNQWSVTLVGLCSEEALESQGDDYSRREKQLRGE